MASRVLIVSSVKDSIKGLEDKLKEECFDVITVSSRFKALEICQCIEIDVVILDEASLDINVFELCEELKSHDSINHIPVAMLTDSEQESNRLHGLKVSVDDFLNRSLSNTQLIFRIENLLKFKNLIDELLFFSKRYQFQSIEKFLSSRKNSSEIPDLVLLMSEDKSSQEDLVKLLKPVGDVIVFSEPQAAAYAALEEYFGLIIVNTVGASFDTMYLYSQLRLLEKIRFVPILIILSPDDLKVTLPSIRLGIDDYILHPIEPNEFIVRCLMQIRRKQLQEILMSVIEGEVKSPVMDSLTGTKNRYYFENYLQDFFNHAYAEGSSLSLILIDVDGFKEVNNVHGYEVGNNLLYEFACRVRSVVCCDDVVCRYENDEFILLISNVSTEFTKNVVNRLRFSIENQPFKLSPNFIKRMSASFGVASLGKDIESLQHLIKVASGDLHKNKTLRKVV